MTDHCREICTLKTRSVFAMSTLFGSTNPTTGTAASNNTTGDISKDIALNTPPEDGISELSFSPQSEHLAVSSWDKKVRIYEINNVGGSEGKALFEHEGPVLSCCWSKVKRYPTRDVSASDGTTHVQIRTAPRSPAAAPTKPRGCSISAPAARPHSKSPRTTSPSGACGSSKLPKRTRPCW